jgi:hypothetical protein
VSDTSQALPLQIRVMDGPLAVANLQAGQPPGVVSLTGRSGPYRPVKYDQGMRVKTTFYPGNPEGSQQIIGKEFRSTTFTGTWKDRYLGDGAARQLVDLFEGIQNAGPSLEVTWGAGLDDVAVSVVGKPIIRVGVLAGFNFSPDRPQDIAWEMTFDWRGRGETSAPAVTATAMINPREGFRTVVDDLQFVSDVTESYRDSLLFGIQQAANVRLSQALTSIASAEDKIRAATSVITTTASFPAGAARSLLGAANLAIDACSDLENVVAGLLDPSRTLLPTDLGTELLKTKDRLFELLGASSQAKGSARATADGVEDRVTPEVIAEVQAPAGVDLRDLALRFYGDPDAWFAIADFNDLPSSQVPNPPAGVSDSPGRAIQIPRLQAGPQADLRQNC